MSLFGRTSIWANGAVALGAVALLALTGAQAVQSFLPPRTAVVNISQVFDGYDKVKDSQSRLSTKFEDLKNRLDELKKKYEELTAELQILQKGSDAYSAKRLEIKTLEIDVEALQETEAKSLKASLRDVLNQIRDEITQEIQAFAKAKELDMVLEKTVTAESNGAASFRWPIVHYARPEIDITGEITQLLNEKYRKP